MKPLVHRDGDFEISVFVPVMEPTKVEAIISCDKINIRWGITRRVLKEEYTDAVMHQFFEELKEILCFLKIVVGKVKDKTRKDTIEMMNSMHFSCGSVEIGENISETDLDEEEEDEEESFETEPKEETLEAPDMSDAVEFEVPKEEEKKVDELTDWLYHN